ncbi:MAG TPA: thioredoxin domain-containing protein [Allosphingosinicella sp.]|jgi:protein-disulfide isomerase|nr:thioredoxin domain-containing protein [Allosphingosinicella sp.]
MKTTIRRTTGTASLLALALLLGACGGDGGNTVSASKAPDQLPRIAAPNNGDWTETVNQTDEGWIMGNPNAPTKLVEYASITCPHCADFSEQGGARLREYVRTGQVSWEFRPFMIFPTDPGIFMLLRCQPPQSFFAVSDQLYHSQSEWTGRAQPQLAQSQQMPLAGRAAFLTQAAGLDEFFRQRGMPAAQVGQCLNNQAELQRLQAITDRAASEEGVRGTPTFLINGEQAVGVDTWAKLEPRLQAALP